MKAGRKSASGFVEVCNEKENGGLDEKKIVVK